MLTQIPHEEIKIRRKAFAFVEKSHKLIMVVVRHDNVFRMTSDINCFHFFISEAQWQKFYRQMRVHESSALHVGDDFVGWNVLGGIDQEIAEILDGSSNALVTKSSFDLLEKRDTLLQQLTLCGIEIQIVAN